MARPIPIRRTTIEVGTAFEKHALSFLNKSMSMSLRRVGGANDGGVDLRGWWWVPRMATPAIEFAASENDGGLRRLRVLAQCKAEKKSVGPRAVRELEGVMSQLEFRREQQSTAEAAIAILISQSGFTKNAMQHATQSRIPLMLLHLPGGQPTALTLMSSSPESDTGTFPNQERIKVESAWWNRSLSHGILGGKMELRREVLVTSDGLGASTALWMDGKKLDRCVPSEVDELEGL
ncbi:hypothetical protein I315_00748 [Cryptococcus gattii Ru294]|uniref:Restriction endonuclease type IV Mrr domain-containing protein n=2 Tax=Cryptococcus gattii TaxID=37769 RepID=E6R6S0_CRYGW|nr:uncharacterized protein CGB_E2220W [Cryptococcus gattii WM276]KIR56571.1 hypothetical protein I315_00748 [Cryptococcus gattii Ru294]KIR78486.1 hypothetical protein I306_04412 [Cryptococcus gattii EJB2]KIY34666.1 hypothetical protein I305_02856 [Cryptococcus gattii E566]KJE04945.1 hypothetical protein I311_01395 [Cryptococcus gattii NT-10]ADV22405.1 hypothetical protein CNBE1640 [Cryptococcus gattii WM276]